MKVTTQNGFTLVEVMVSLLLLALVITGGMELFFNSNSFLRIALDKRIAAEIANTKLEKIRLQSYASLPASGIPYETSVKIGDIDATDTTIYTDMEGGDYKKVDVKLTWQQAGKSSTREVALTTFIAP